MLGNEMLTLTGWQLDAARFFKELELDMSRDEIVDCLYKVFEELQYIDAETEVDLQTRKGYVMLNKLLFTILRAEAVPDLKIVISRN